MLIVKQRGIKYPFRVFGMTRPGIEIRYPGPFTNTLHTRPIERYFNREKKKKTQNKFYAGELFVQHNRWKKQMTIL